MSPGQTGHITGQMGRVPGTDGTHTRGCPAKILYVYWFFSFLKQGNSLLKINQGNPNNQGKEGQGAAKASRIPVESRKNRFRVASPNCNRPMSGKATLSNLGIARFSI